jgi:hypothetical protein
VLAVLVLVAPAGCQIGVDPAPPPEFFDGATATRNGEIRVEFRDCRHSVSLVQLYREVSGRSTGDYPLLWSARAGAGQEIPAGQAATVTVGQPPPGFTVEQPLDEPLSGRLLFIYGRQPSDAISFGFDSTAPQAGSYVIEMGKGLSRDDFQHRLDDICADQE